MRRVHLVFPIVEWGLESHRSERCARKKRPSETRLRRAGPGRPRFAAMLLAVLVGFAGACLLAGQASTSSEYQVKAAFLFHFAQFVDWPPEAFKDADDPLTYCTIGEDPFGGALDQSLRGKTVGGRQLRIQHFKQPQEIRGCHILFIAAGEQRRLGAAMASVSGHPVLTVGESDHFVREGGIIGFCLQDNKIRFEINLEAAEKANLKISAKLLALAKTVIGNPRGS